MRYINLRLTYLLTYLLTYILHGHVGLPCKMLLLFNACVGCVAQWRSSTVLDLRSVGCGFDSKPLYTVKLLTHTCHCHQAV